ncbi:beta-lactamase family protein [Cellulomonas humilata]|uniref:Beta-lactamase family protein n=1 Tax=Cellulomonas humilata TaxID=144055 RepID=A0A7Y6DZJ0_9CELL|nr:serine hydrolase domain-containing protein [Cellulomonas humilata]NUU19540.1 beta-lactamase family protein [Cellulomonas humilata]
MSTLRRTVLALTLASTTALVAPSAALAGGGHHGGPRADVTQQALNRLVRDDGLPGALAAVTDARGRERDLTAGVGDLATRSRVPVDGQVRIGSSSKTYTAVVVLQLVAEGTVGLDEPIETYLPGLVRGPDYDGHDITVRQLLNHTSGVPDYVGGLGNLVENRGWYWTSRDLVDLALTQERDFAPAEGWNYSNTNYVVLGLMVERVTHRPLAEAITQRIIEPLGLTGTYVPDRGEQTIRAPHPHGYDAVEPLSGDLVDVTDLDASMADAAGDIVATPSDVNRFYAALLDGTLLEPAQLEQMKQTVPGSRGILPNAEYGLGLVRFDLSCGTVAWGHGGDIPGYETRSAVTEAGREATIAVTAEPSALRGDEESVTAVAGRVFQAMDTALCS